MIHRIITLLLIYSLAFTTHSTAGASLYTLNVSFMAEDTTTGRRLSTRARKAPIKLGDDERVDLPRHHSTAPIDASNYGVRWLKRQMKKETNLFENHYDFIKVPVEAIRKIFWEGNKYYENRGYTYMDPPRALRRHPKLIKDFLKLGDQQKRDRIKLYSVFDNSEELDALYNDESEADDSIGEVTFTTGIDGAWECGGWDGIIDGFGGWYDDVSFPCCGVTMETISQSRLSDERMADVKFGFKHTIREALVGKANLMRPDNFKWDDEAYGDADGVLTTGVDARVDWLVELKRPVDVEFECATIRDIQCLEQSSKEGMPCTSCCNSKQKLIRRMTSTGDLRRKPLSKYTTNKVLQRTPSLINEKAVKQAEEIKALKSSYRAKLFKKMSHNEGVSVELNGSSDLIFNDDVAANMEEFLSQEVSKDSLALYVFKESVRKHKIAKASGVRAVRHCPLAIRLGALIRGKMGYSGGLYDLVASALGLPTDRTLQEYTIPTTNDPDGILIKNIMREMLIFNRRNPNADTYDWNRHVTLAFDSMSCKGRFVVNYHTNEIVGIASDCLRSTVILDELKELQKSDIDISPEQLEEQAAEVAADTNDPPMPEVAKHFLVFAATTWSPEAHDGRRSKHQFICARYGLKSIDSNFLVPTIRKIILHLSYCGFIVDTIVGDGASENRSTFKILATITAKTILGEHYPEELLEDLPTEMKIAFPHPNPEYADRIKIFIGGEMPHWVKKFRNAMDSSKRELTFNGCQFNLNMFKDIWEKMKSGVGGRNDVRVYKFGKEHFDLNSYNKMRVFLAVQIPSQTMIRMIKDYCKEYGDSDAEEADLESYEPVIEIFEKVDRLVDIINATRRDLNVGYIDCPQHKHIFELFSVLQLFKEWKDQASGFEFITRESWEDLQWMVFGLVGVACTYLDDDKKKKLHQGRSGSDVCEHIFAKIRQVNTNPNPQQCREITSKISGQGVTSSNLFCLKGKSNTAGTRPNHDDYFSEVHKRDDKKNGAKKTLIG